MCCAVCGIGLHHYGCLNKVLLSGFSFRYLKTGQETETLSINKYYSPGEKVCESFSCFFVRFYFSKNRFDRKIYCDL